MKDGQIFFSYTEWRFFDDMCKLNGIPYREALSYHPMIIWSDEEEDEADRVDSIYEDYRK